MKRIQFNLSEVFQTTYATIARFPAAVGSTLLLTVLTIYHIELDAEKTDEALQRLLFTTFIGLPWLTGIHLFQEKYIRSSAQRLALWLVALMFLFFVYRFIAPELDLSQMRRSVRFLCVFLIAHLGVAIVWHFRTGSILDFWEYNKNILIRWFIATFYTLVLYLGLNMAMLAVDQLFNVDVRWQFYTYIGIVLAFFFHPVYFLSGFPREDQLSAPRLDYTKALRTLVFYILIPLTALYFVILYAYGIKIAISWTLPRGWVSSLVLGFSGAGLLTYLFNYGLAEKEQNKLSTGFRKYFFYVLAPLVVLLFVAIGRRLDDYGFTPARYFVLLTGIWLLLSSLYFIFSKTDNIKFIPTSLAIFLVVGTMSPWDAFEVSSASQYRRLTTFLGDKGMMEEGKLGKSMSGLDELDKWSVRTMVETIHQNGDGDVLLDLVKDTGTIAEPESDEFLNTFFVATGLEQGLESPEQGEMIYLSSGETGRIPVTGYDWLFNFYLNFNGSDDDLSLSEKDGGILIIGPPVSDTISLQEFLLQLDKKQQLEGSDRRIDQAFEFRTAGYHYKIYFKHLNYHRSPSKLRVDYIDGVLLAAKK
ncbi:MAG TPA: DUF4153 domain-containing protein [Saprospiraceae bacterium]|nr:DUF4153 domain-containing protein [Saprospiraceae bacterium]